ncbi:MAG: hypothetical protein ACFUZC_10170 [Chthoniobacteraceae bacterium]
MFALARETGWSRDFILWDLPLDEALQYHHCALRAANCWTVPSIPDAGKQLVRLEAALSSKMEDDE